MSNSNFAVSVDKNRVHEVGFPCWCYGCGKPAQGYAYASTSTMYRGWCGGGECYRKVQYGLAHTYLTCLYKSKMHYERLKKINKWIEKAKQQQ